MRVNKSFVPACFGLVGLVAIVASIAMAAPSDDANSAAPPDFKLPPGWTAEDMEKCMMAGKPGKMHERLANDVGVWRGENSIWMAPGVEPVVSDCTCTFTAIMDGRYTKCDMEGEMPGMGPYHGVGLTGFDNVSEQFVATWIDNHSTGIMTGQGELSADGKTLNWNYAANCPLTKKPVVMRQVETMTSADSKTLEMFGNDPKSGKEYQMMRLELTRQK
jgi:hypothetical protein